MNKQELIARIKCLDEPYLKETFILELIERLDEPQPIKLKDVIARIKGFDGGTQKVWLNEILNELGSDYGTLKYKAGYEQGKFESSFIPYDGPQKVTVPQFVADWIKYCKNTNVTLVRALLVEEASLYNYANQKDSKKLKEFLKVKENQEAFASAWLDGYTIEKEKKFTVKLTKTQQYLYCIDNDFTFVTYARPDDNPRLYHTRKELEEAGFGEVFNSPLFEVEEVTE